MKGRLQQTSLWGSQPKSQKQQPQDTTSNNVETSKEAKPFVSSILSINSRRPSLEANGNQRQSPIFIDSAPLYSNPSPKASKQSDQSVKSKDFANENPYLDHITDATRTPTTTRLPRRGALKFFKPGHFASIADQRQKQVELAILSKEILKETEELLNIESAVDLLEKETKAGYEKPNPVLMLEWWDAPFMSHDNTVDRSLITGDCLESLQSLSPLCSTLHSVGMSCGDLKFLLTKEELRQARRKRRLAEQTEHQDLIRAGLLPPDPPKLKLSSLPALLQHNINSEDSNATALEQRIKQDIEQRKRTHEQANAARALTREERAQKKRSKLIKQGRADGDGTVHGILWIITNESNAPLTKRQQLKVMANARELYLRGGLYLAKRSISKAVSFNMATWCLGIGGPKALAKLGKLLEYRLGNKESISNVRVLWQGIVGKIGCDKEESSLEITDELDHRQTFVHYVSDSWLEMDMFCKRLDEDDKKKSHHTNIQLMPFWKIVKDLLQAGQ